MPSFFAGFSCRFVWADMGSKELRDGFEDYSSE